MEANIEHIAATTTPMNTALHIWAHAGGNLDRALDLRDELSEASGLPGRTWGQIEDAIWEIAKG